MRTRVMCVLALIAIVGVVVSGNLQESRLSQSFFIIWSSLEVITFLDFSFYAAKITLFSAPVYFLLITIIGRYFLNEKRKNTLHIYAAIWALVIIASSQLLYFAREQYAATPAPHYVELVNVWIALVLILIHWRSNIRLLNSKDALIDSTNSQLELSNKVLSLIGHNIRTPLTNLSLQLQIAQRSEPKNKRYEQLSESVNRLIDITEATIIQNKPIDSSEGSSIELVQEIQKIYKDRVEITVDNNVYFHRQANVSQIFLCLQNLLDNAIYWSPNSKPSLNIGICSNSLCITVEDGGKGMTYSAAQNYGSKMAGSLNTTGKGIGMYYSIKLINQIGLNLHLRTRENVGTQILICNDAKRELKFTSAQGWLHKSFYPNSSEENLIVDKISNY